RPRLTSPLFPYTTLFRSLVHYPIASLIHSASATLFLTSSHSLARYPIVSLIRSAFVTSFLTLSRLLVHYRIVSLIHCTTYSATRSEEHTSELQSRFDLVC